MAPAAPSSQQLTPAQANALATQAILSQSLVRVQQIFNTTLDPANQQVVNVVPRNVGLILGFFVDVSLTLTNGSGGTATLTPFGAANALSKIQFTDFGNYLRHNTTGWHVHFLNSARSGRPFGLSSATPTPAPVGYGNNFGSVMSAPGTLAASATGTVTMRYFVPVAYGRNNLDGAVYANLLNAQALLSLALNTGAMIASGDPTGAIYTGSAGTVTSATVTVYQMYRDQLPVATNGQPILPQLSLSSAYMLQSSNLGSITPNQDYPIPYSNFRSYYSTFAVYDNGGVLNGGTDINYWGLQSANFTDIFKLSPWEVSLMTRAAIGTDFPPGVYYFDHRSDPIATNQYGNMQLNLNASSVASGATVLPAYEMLAQISALTGAASLPGGAG